MRTARWRRPSPGFLLLMLTWAATAGLFVWGLQEPELHRTWDLTARLEMEDASPPTEGEIGAVGRVLRAHPEWATTIAAGRPFAVLEAPVTGCLRFDISHLMIPASAQEVPVRLQCKPDVPVGPGADVGPGANVVTIETGGAPVTARCGPQAQVLRIPGAPEARLVAVRRTPGPRFRDDQSCPILLVPLSEDLGAGGPEPDSSQEGDDAAKD